MCGVCLSTGCILLCRHPGFVVHSLQGININQSETGVSYDAASIQIDDLFSSKAENVLKATLAIKERMQL